MLQIGVCDDDVQFTSKIEKMIIDIGHQKGILVEIDVFFDGSTLLEHIQNNDVRYDLLFLDIEMQDMNGLEVAKRIRKFDDLVYLIYITAHKNYAVEAYDVHPFQFILKPIKEEILKKHFLGVYEKISGNSHYFYYKYQKNFYKVFFKDILYFESDKRVIYIHLADGTVQKYYDRLNVIEARMRQYKVNFLRIHRSLLVNTIYIKEKTFDKVQLRNGTVLYISEDRRKDINIQYAKMIEKDMWE